MKECRFSFLNLVLKYNLVQLIQCSPPGSLVYIPTVLLQYLNSVFSVYILESIFLWEIFHLGSSVPQFSGYRRYQKDWYCPLISPKTWSKIHPSSMTKTKRKIAIVFLKNVLRNTSLKIESKVFFLSTRK